MPGVLLDHVDAILATVELPDHREDDARPGRERFYRQHVLQPSRWLRVVVDFNVDPAWIATVLVQDQDPRANVEYDATGQVVGMTLVNVRWLLERDGELTITWPAGHVQTDELAQALASAA